MSALHGSDQGRLPVLIKWGGGGRVDPGGGGGNKGGILTKDYHPPPPPYFFFLFQGGGDVGGGGHHCYQDFGMFGCSQGIETVTEIETTEPSTELAKGPIQ